MGTLRGLKEITKHYAKSNLAQRVSDSSETFTMLKDDALDLIFGKSSELLLHFHG